MRPDLIPLNLLFFSMCQTQRGTHTGQNDSKLIWNCCTNIKLSVCFTYFYASSIALLNPLSCRRKHLPPKLTSVLVMVEFSTQQHLCHTEHCDTSRDATRNLQNPFPEIPGSFSLNLTSLFLVSTASVKRYTERCGTSAQIEEQRKRRYILL